MITCQGFGQVSLPGKDTCSKLTAGDHSIMFINTGHDSFSTSPHSLCIFVKFVFDFEENSSKSAMMEMKMLPGNHGDGYSIENPQILYFQRVWIAIVCRWFCMPHSVTSSRNIDQINTILSSQLKSVQKWLVKNKLSLHLGKPESIIFGTKRKLNVESKLKIECNGNVVKCERRVKYLGVSTAQDMSGCTMANSVIAKINTGLKVLYRKKEYFVFCDRQMLCSTLVQSFF